jgi:D-alanyl-D-alanine carboxypeptidase
MLVVDFTGGQKVICEDRMDAKRHPASLTKMMTVYLLFEAIREKKVSFNTKFTVSKLATLQMPSKINLRVGEKITVLDLIKALIVQSANDAAVVVAEGLCGSVRNFCKLMNAKAISLGMRGTHFENPSGVPDSRQISTARDMMTLGISIYRNFPQFWHFFSLKSFKYHGVTYGAHCKILKWYKGADGGKTGYTCASGFNLFVTANRKDKRKLDKRVFVVVMGFDSGKSRDLYAASLMNKYLVQCGTVDTMENQRKPNKISLGEQLKPSKEFSNNSESVQKVDSKKKARKKVVQKQAEPVIQEFDEVSVKELLEMEKVSATYLEKLYETDEDVVNIVDEVQVGAAK